MSATTDPHFHQREGAGPAIAEAEVWQRAVARLVDHVGVAVVLMVVLLPLGLGAAVLGGAAGFLAGVVSAVVSAGVTLGYFAVLESRDGQTLGKRLLGLRVVDEVGGTPSLSATLRRNCWTALGVLAVVPVVGGLVGSVAMLAAVVTILLGITQDSVTRRGWHDTLAGTRVVRAR